MEDLACFRQKVEQEIREILPGGRTPPFGLEAMNAYHMGFADQNGNLLASAKGKYMRPLFCMALCAGLGGDPDKAVPAAASLELIHRTTLIFDDIQDDGRERNGQPTVWSVWGVNQAINAGLALSCYAHLAAYRCSQKGIPPETTLMILRVLENAVIDLCQGQYLDLTFGASGKLTLGEYFGESGKLTFGASGKLTRDYLGASGKLTLGDYLAMVKGKTAALFGAACEVGALCAGVLGSRADLAREFGINMGIAFQIQDDYLGIWGDEPEVGKTANDLTEKKPSLPIILALEKYPEETNRWLQMKVVTPEVANTIRLWMEKRGIPDTTKDMAVEYAMAAWDKLNALNLDPHWYHEINQFLGFVVGREK